MIDFLSKRQGLVEGVTITGGEPTLERGLAELCQSIKALGYPVKLDTNGSRPDTLGRLLDQNLLDFVAMDIRQALHFLGEITRDISTEDLLGNIFGKFCIGK